jgi:hypothetical protein
MMWLEVLSRNHDVIARHRIDHDAAMPIRIGRAYDNDVILDDPHIAPHHLTLTQDAAKLWVAEDQHSINGLFVDPAEGKPRRVKQVALSDDRIISIGHTLLRLRTEAYTVAPERALDGSTMHHGGHSRRIWWWLIPAILVMVIITLMQSWLGETGERKPSRYLFDLLPEILLVSVWTGLWALATRLFTGTTRFTRHLLIAVIGVLALGSVDIISGTSAFALSSVKPTEWNYVITWLIFAAIVYFHLREIGHKRLPLKAGIVTTLALLAIGVQWLSKSEQANRFGQPTYVQSLRPPAMRLAAEQTTDEFLSRAEKLKADLDRARTEEKPDNSGAAYDFDD